MHVASMLDFYPNVSLFKNIFNLIPEGVCTTQVDNVCTNIVLIAFLL